MRQDLGDDNKNYITKILIAILVVLSIGAGLNIYFRNFYRPSRTRTFHRAVKPTTPPKQLSSEAKKPTVEKQDKTTEQNPTVGAQAPAIQKGQDTQQTPPKKAIPGKSTTDEKYVKLSIYAYPPAIIFIDGQKVVDENGKEVIAPVKGLKIKAGRHSIKLVGKDDKSKIWWLESNFTKDNVIYVDSRAGDW